MIIPTKKLIKIKLNKIPNINKETILQDILYNLGTNNDLNKKFIRIYEENFNDFHIEFRMFALDKFFEENKDKSNSLFMENIKIELTRFINFTNLFMTDILYKLNKYYPLTKKKLEKFKNDLYYI